MRNLILALLFVGPLMGKDHALLVVVGSYKNHYELTLPGADKDQEHIQRVCQALGITSDETTLLRDAQVSRDTVLAHLRRIARQAGPQDRVLFYFSGHGIQVRDTSGDEEDLKDEALGMYALNMNENLCENYLLDDEIDEILASMATPYRYSIFDSCHSQSAHKGIFINPSKGKAKNLIWLYDELPCGENAADYFGRSQSEEGGVHLAACADYQKTLSYANGSMFTLALMEALEKNPNISHYELITEIDGIISDRDEFLQQTPQLSGSDHLKRMPAFYVPQPMVPVSQHVSQGYALAQPTLPEMLREIALRESSPLSISLAKQTYAIGEPMSLSIYGEASGHVSIFCYDHEKGLAQVFPNEYQEGSYIPGGTHLNLGNDTYDLEVDGPLGTQYLIVLMGETPLDLRNPWDPQRLMPTSLDSFSRKFQNWAARQQFILGTAVIPFRVQ